MRAIIPALLAGLIASTQARAEWSKVAAEWPDLTPTQRDWFIHQHNGKGFLCCSEADGHPTDWDIRRGHDGKPHYWAVVDFEWREIPDEAVVNVPNPVHRAVIWFSSTVMGPDGKKLIRCFVPGEGA